MAASLKLAVLHRHRLGTAAKTVAIFPNMILNTPLPALNTVVPLALELKTFRPSK